MKAMKGLTYSVIIVVVIVCAGLWAGIFYLALEVVKWLS